MCLALHQVRIGQQIEHGILLVWMELQSSHGIVRVCDALSLHAREMGCVGVLEVVLKELDSNRIEKSG